MKNMREEQRFLITYVIDDISKCMRQRILAEFIDKNGIVEVTISPLFGKRHSFPKFDRVELNSVIICDEHKNPFNFKVVVQEHSDENRSRYFNRYLLVGSITKENIRLFNSLGAQMFTNIQNNKSMRNERSNLKNMLNNYVLDKVSYKKAKSKLKDIENCIEIFDSSYGKIDRGALMRFEGLTEYIYSSTIGRDPEESPFIGKTIIISEPVTHAMYFELISIPCDRLLDSQSLSYLFERY